MCVCVCVCVCYFMILLLFSILYWGNHCGQKMLTTFLLQLNMVKSPQSPVIIMLCYCEVILDAVGVDKAT